MAIEIVLDTVNGSQLTLFGNAGGSAVRAGVALNLPVDTTVYTPDAVLHAIATAPDMPAMNSPYPTVGYLYLNRIQVDSLPNQAGQATFKLFYEAFQGVGTTYIIETGGTPSMIETNMFPGTNLPLRTSYTAPDGSTAIEKYIPPSLVTLSLYTALIHIRVTKLIYGTLTPTEADAFADNLTCTNNAVWLGRPIGTWLTTDAQAVVSPYSGYYVQRLEASRIRNQIWSSYGIIESGMTGRAAGGDDINATLNALKALPYIYGPRPENGAIRVDPYTPINFATLFGFSS